MALAHAGCDTVAEVSRLGRTHFEGRPNLGAKTLQELAAVGHWPEKPQTAVDIIVAALVRSVAPEQTREVAGDVMLALRRSGFVVVASKAVSKRVEARS